MEPIKYKGQQFEAVEPANENRPCNSCYFKKNGCADAPDCTTSKMSEFVWKLIEPKTKSNV